MIPDARTPEEHRFLVLGMLLMHDHPRIGASFLAVHRGEAGPYVKGWNVMEGRVGKTQTRWVFIGDGSGYTTFRKPDVEPGRIHKTGYTPPPLEETTAWNWTLQLGNAHRSQGWALKVIDRIRAVSEQRTYPDDPEAERRAVTSALRGLQQRAASFREPDALAGQILEIMRPCMSLEQLGTDAAAVLTAVLAKVASFAAGADPVQPQLTLRDTLGDRTVGLLSSRDGMRPSGFARMTYLAALYARAALIHSDLIRSQFALQPGQETLLAKWDQNVDELLAHEIFPHFVYFAMPSVERVLKLGEKQWQSMSGKYGDINAPAFDLDTLNFAELGPCPARLLQDAAAQLRAHSR